MIAKGRVGLILSHTVTSVGLGFIICSGAVMLLTGRSATQPKVWGFLELIASVMVIAGMHGWARARTPEGRKALGLGFFLIMIMGLIGPAPLAYALLTPTSTGSDFFMAALAFVWIIPATVPWLAVKPKGEVSHG